MTMRETWNRMKRACQTGYTLEQRIKDRIDLLAFDVDCDHKITVNRLTGLEAHVDALRTRSENVDAFYVKTVTQALGERQDRIAQSLEARINHCDQEIHGIEAALRTELDDSLKRSLALEARFAALVSKLRAGLE